MSVTQLCANSHTAKVTRCRNQTKRSHERHFLITQHHVHFTPQWGPPVSPSFPPPPPTAHSLSSTMFLSLSNLEICHWLSSNGINFVPRFVKIRQMVQKKSDGADHVSMTTNHRFLIHMEQSARPPLPITKDQSMGGHERATAFCTVSPNICGSSVRIWRCVTIPAPGIFRWHTTLRTVC